MFRFPEWGGSNDRFRRNDHRPRSLRAVCGGPLTDDKGSGSSCVRRAYVLDLENIDADPPFAARPAVKEHFFYSTKAKTRRANSRAELRVMFQRAAALVGPGELMVQDLIPGAAVSSSAIVPFSKKVGRSGAWLYEGPVSTLQNSTARAPTSRPYLSRLPLPGGVN